MSEQLRAQLRQEPLVIDLADRTRNCGESRSFFETLDRHPCPIFVDSIRRAYRQRGGTLEAPAELVAEVVIQLAFAPLKPVTLLDRVRARLRRHR